MRGRNKKGEQDLRGKDFLVLRGNLCHIGHKKPTFSKRK